MKEKFIDLLKEVKRPGINALLSYLENNTDFFEAPASTNFHLSKKGGLLEHSLNVYENLFNNDSTYDEETIKIVALLHDICKANFYEYYEKNVKNDKGLWIKEPAYRINDQLPLGHGEKSVIIIQKFISLSEEEVMAIRWHMGGYEPKENYSYLAAAFNKYPLAVKLHIADLEATYLNEKADTK